jgi:hypothetical protein
VEYPARIFAAVGEVEKGIGQRLKSNDRRAVLPIYARENEDDDRPASYLRKNLRQSTPTTNASLALSSRFLWNGKGRSTTAAAISRAAVPNCFDLVYPQDGERAWDRLVTRVSLSLRPLER